MPNASEIPACPGEPQPGQPRKESRSYEIELVTPLFGGGVEPGVCDASLPIRPSSIRGHLRHWWRVARGYALGEQMWRREEEVFGSVDFPSPLSVSVEGASPLSLVDPDYGERYGPIAYALFAAIENGRQVAKEGIRFSLRLEVESESVLNRRRAVENAERRRKRQPLLPETIAPIWPDLELAMRLWASIGGVGARTRRGCGAIDCRQIPFDPKSLPARVFVGRKEPNPLAAWKAALLTYREFRQTPRGKRHLKQTKRGSYPVPGRSHWPEADSIRHLTGCALKPAPGAAPLDCPPDENPNDHSSPVVLRSVLPAFPKAQLGMPINFHFVDWNGKDQPGSARKDPQDTQLVPLVKTDSGRWVEADRLASPVITRPVRHNNECRPAVIILDLPWPNEIKVRLKGKRSKANGSDLSEDLSLDRVTGDQLRQLRPMRGQATALEALVTYLKDDLKYEEISQ